MVLLLLLTGVGFGQTFEDVVAKFNEGADDINKGDFTTAIGHLQEVIAMAATAGSDADDLVSKSKEQIPLLNYQVAIGYMKQKDYENAIPYLEKTVDLSDAYGNNEEYKNKAMKYLPQLLTGVGTQKLKSDELDEAMTLFDDAIRYSPDYPKAYLGKGLVHKLKYDEDEMIESLTKAIDLGKSSNDSKTVEDAQQALADYFVEMGNMEIEDMDPAALEFDMAIEAYQKALKFSPKNSDAHYKLAIIANLTEDFDGAIEHAKAALETEEVEIKIAAINFELGNAYFSAAELDLACEAFKKAKFGLFEDRAVSKMEKIPGCF